MEFISMAHPSGSAPFKKAKVDMLKIVNAATKSNIVGHAILGF
jgi:hypothetical protein